MIKRAFSKVRYEMGCCPLFKGNGCPFRVDSRPSWQVQRSVLWSERHRPA